MTKVNTGVTMLTLLRQGSLNGIWITELGELECEVVIISLEIHGRMTWTATLLVDSH